MNNIKVPQPPKIPANTNYDSNYSEILKSDSIKSTSITDGVATLRGGFLSGLQLPEQEMDAVPKSYIRGSVPSGPLKSIQYNKNNLFTGSADLKYIGGISVGSLSIGVPFTDGYLTIDDSYINNIVEKIKTIKIN